MPGDLTSLLERWGAGDRAAFGELIPRVYEELHAMARSFLRDERAGHTLQCTALVHEAYLRLAGVDGVRWENRAQFFSIASRILRHVLVDYARQRNAAKRGGGGSVAPMEEALALPVPEDLDLAALDESLERLAAMDARKAELVTLRYFGGLSIEETAETLRCSPTTVKREWTFAKAWLRKDLGLD